MASTLPQLNIVDFAPQIFWLLVFFSLLYSIIRVKIVPYFSAETEDRHKKISESYTEAKKLQAKAERLAEEYHEKLQAVHLRANDLILEAKAKVKRNIDKEKNRLNDEINLKINAYQDALDENLSKADKDLSQDVEAFNKIAREKIFQIQQI